MRACSSRCSWRFFWGAARHGGVRLLLRYARTPGRRSEKRLGAAVENLARRLHPCLYVGFCLRAVRGSDERRTESGRERRFLRLSNDLTRVPAASSPKRASAVPSSPAARFIRIIDIVSRSAHFPFNDNLRGSKRGDSRLNHDNHLCIYINDG